MGYRRKKLLGYQAWSCESLSPWFVCVFALTIVSTEMLEPTR